MAKQFTYEFDEEKYDAFIALINYISQMEDSKGFLRFLFDRKADRGFMKMAWEVSDRGHTAGMCKDPNCKRKNG